MPASNFGNLSANSWGQAGISCLFVFKKELLCKRLHPQNFHETLLAQNDASATSFLKHLRSTQLLMQTKFKMHEWKVVAKICIVVTCKEYLNLVDLFTQLKAGIFLNTDEKATHTLPCFSIKKTDRRKKICHPLMKQAKNYRYSQYSEAKSMIWNRLLEVISGMLSFYQSANIIYGTLNTT